MFRLKSLTFAFSIFCTSALGQPADVETPSIQFEKSKKISVAISCGKPNRDSIVNKRGYWTFTVKHGDVGRCSTDATAKNAATYVPHMERAEVSSHNRLLPRNKKIRVAAKIQLHPGIPPVHNTTVFQVHQWVDACKCGPPLMLSFDERGRLRARVLREHHKHDKFVLSGWTRESFEGRWVEIAVDVVNREGFSDIEIFLAGKSVLKKKALIQKNSGLYFKSGIYREGSAKTQLPTDRVYMKEPTYFVFK